MEKLKLILIASAATWHIHWGALQHCSTAAAAHPRLAVSHNTTHISIAVLGGLSCCGPSFSHYTPITSYLGWWYCFCLSHTLQRNTWHQQPAALRRSPYKKPAAALLSRARNANISQSRRRPSWFKGPLTHFAKQAWTWYCCRCVDVIWGCWLKDHKGLVGGCKNLC